MAATHGDDVCSVCLDELIFNKHVACCKHVFHEACVQKLEKCPLCRKQWKAASLSLPNLNFYTTTYRRRTNFVFDYDA